MSRVNYLGLRNGFPFLPETHGVEVWDGSTYADVSPSNSTDSVTPVVGNGTDWVGPLTFSEAMSWCWRMRSLEASLPSVNVSSAAHTRKNTDETAAVSSIGDPVKQQLWFGVLGRFSTADYNRTKGNAESYIVTNCQNTGFLGVSAWQSDGYPTEGDPEFLSPVATAGCGVWLSQDWVLRPFRCIMAKDSASKTDEYYVYLGGLYAQVGAWAGEWPWEEIIEARYFIGPSKSLYKWYGSDAPEAVTQDMKLTLPGSGRILTVPLYGWSVPSGDDDVSAEMTSGFDAKPNMYWEYDGLWDEDSGAWQG